MGPAGNVLRWQCDPTCRSKGAAVAARLGAIITFKNRTLAPPIELIIAVLALGREIDHGTPPPAEVHA
jgi:hypothetical protein